VCTGYRRVCAPLPIVGFVGSVYFEGAVRNNAQTAPFELLPELEDLRHKLLSLWISFLPDRSEILVLYLCPALPELADYQTTGFRKSSAK